MDFLDWIKENREHGAIFVRIDGYGNTGFYEVIFRNNDDPEKYFSNPLYYIWIDGKLINISLDINAAYKIWIIKNTYKKELE